MTRPSDDATETGHPLARARALTRLLDSALQVPGTGIRFGLDPLLGLVPGLGDATGAAMAGYLVVLGARIGAPGSVIARMVGNVALDLALGAIPVAGDLADVVWKANNRNLALLERYLERPSSTRAASRAILVAAVGSLVVLAGAGIALAFFAVRGLVGLLS